MLRRTGMTEKRYFTLLSAIAILVIGVCSAQAESVLDRVIDSSLNRRDCDAFPVLELPKLDCDVRYGTQISSYLRQQDLLLQERIEAIRQRTWDWLAGQPMNDCSRIPAAERDKFFCGPGQSGANSHMDQLAGLHRAKENIERQLDRLQNRITQLETRERALPEIAQTGSSADYRGLIDKVERQSDIQALLRRLSTEFNAGPRELPAISSIRISKLVSGSQIWTDEFRENTLIEATPREKFVVVFTTLEQSDAYLVLDQQFGFGYVSTSQIQDNL